MSCVCERGEGLVTRMSIASATSLVPRFYLAAVEEN